MSEFELDQRTQHSAGGPIEVLVLSGQLDAHTFPKLQETLEAVGQAERPWVVLDCSQLKYISSAGLGVLKKTSHEFRQKQGDVRLASLPEKINNVVTLLGFSQVIQVFGTVEEAVQSFP